jgi:hypothetical protein
METASEGGAQTLWRPARRFNSREFEMVPPLLSPALLSALRTTNERVRPLRERPAADNARALG